MLDFATHDCRVNKKRASQPAVLEHRESNLQRLPIAVVKRDRKASGAGSIIRENYLARFLDEIQCESEFSLRNRRVVPERTTDVVEVENDGVIAEARRSREAVSRRHFVRHHSFSGPSSKSSSNGCRPSRSAAVCWFGSSASTASHPPGRPLTPTPGNGANARIAVCADPR